LSKRVKPAVDVPDADLRLALRDALERLAKPMSVAELRKALPKPYQRPPAEISRLLGELVKDRGLFTFQEGKTSKYSLKDPKPTITQAVLVALRDKPLQKKELTERVKRGAPGFKKLLPAALAELIASKAVYEHPKAGAKNPGGYGLTPPDPAPFLAAAIKEIKAAQKKLAPSGVTLAAVYAALGRALKIEDDVVDDESSVLAALAELASRHPPNTLLSVQDLRATRSIPKVRFDGAVLRLFKANKVRLYHHDFPQSLPEAERAALVQDNHGVHYIGIAPGKDS